MSVLDKSTGVILTRVKSIEGSVDMGDLPNPFDDTSLHEHKCKNCEAIFQCALPLCDGGLADPDLCPECAETLEGIW